MRGTDRRCPLAFLACVLTTFAPAEAFEGRHRRDRGPLPANAIQPPGASYENQPSVDRRQKIEIVREATRASVSGIIHRPVDAAEEMLTRSLERVSIRVRETARPFVFAHKLADREPVCPPFPGTDLGGGVGGTITPAKITFLPSSESALQGLLALIDEAHSRIDLMIYGWQDDPTGREVVRDWPNARRQGIVVRLLVDRTGFLIHNPAAARRTDVSRRTQARAERLRDRTPFAVLSARSP